MAAPICVCLAACAGRKARVMQKRRKRRYSQRWKPCRHWILETFNALTDNYVSTERNWLGIPVRRRYRVFSELHRAGDFGGSEREGQPCVCGEDSEESDVGDHWCGDGGRTVCNLRAHHKYGYVRCNGRYTVHVLEKMTDGKGTGAERTV